MATNAMMEQIPNPNVFSCDTCHQAGAGSDLNAFGVETQIHLTYENNNPIVDWSSLWELDADKLLTLYKEFHRILRSGGELRVFPVFYGNYSRNNVELHEYLNTHFAIRCLRPVRDYSKEPPVYLEDDVIKATVARAAFSEAG